MRYWRTPLVRFGANRTPYLPDVAMKLLARGDRILRLGKPWDILIRASRK